MSCCHLPERRPRLGPNEIDAVLVSSEFGPVLPGHILGPVDANPFPGPGGVVFVQCRQALAQLNPPFNSPFWARTTGWFVAKRVYPPLPIAPSFQLVEVYTAGDDVLVDDFEPAVRAAWEATGAHGVYVSPTTEGLPAPLFPEEDVAPGVAVTTHLVAVRMTRVDLVSGQARSVFRMASELVDTIRSDDVSNSILRRAPGGRVVGILI